MGSSGLTGPDELGYAARILVTSSLEMFGNSRCSQATRSASVDIVGGTNRAPSFALLCYNISTRVTILGFKSKPYPDKDSLAIYFLSE